MIKLGKWDLSTPNNKDLKIFSTDMGNEYLIRSKKNDLAEITYDGANIVITVGEAKVNINPEMKSIQISPLKLI